jgi:hypothetical protein
MVYLYTTFQEKKFEKIWTVRKKFLIFVKRSLKVLMTNLH